MRHQHDIERGSNLDLILRGFNGAVNRFADILGHGLEAIAVALSTPQDNSEEVKRITARIRASREALAQALENQKEK